MRRKCARCGRFFTPAKKTHRFCSWCFGETAPLGGTTARIRPGAPARRHGGVWRTTDGLRPVTLRGNATSRQIVWGMAAFLSDLYQQPTRISTLLRKAGLSGSDIECLRQQRWLNDFALRFCPRLWKWLGDTVGTKARAVLIDLYGLYGSRGRKMDSLARKLETTTQNVVELRDKALRQMRVQQNQAELEELIVSTAQSILAVYQKDAAERGE
jgi:hypothetical protein